MFPLSGYILCKLIEYLPKGQTRCKYPKQIIWKGFCINLYNFGSTSLFEMAYKMTGCIIVWYWILINQLELNIWLKRPQMKEDNVEYICLISQFFPRPFFTKLYQWYIVRFWDLIYIVVIEVLALADLFSKIKKKFSYIFVLLNSSVGISLDTLFILQITNG